MKELAPREEIVLATKVFNRMRPGPNGMGLSRQSILHEIDMSLKRLGPDYVDIYQIHRADPTTSCEETMEALHDVAKAGKAPLHRRVFDVALGSSPSTSRPPSGTAGRGSSRCRTRSA